MRATLPALLLAFAASSPAAGEDPSIAGGPAAVALPDAWVAALRTH